MPGPAPSLETLDAMLRDSDSPKTSTRLAAISGCAAVFRAYFSATVRSANETSQGTSQSATQSIPASEAPLRRHFQLFRSHCLTLIGTDSHPPVQLLAFSVLASFALLQFDKTGVFPNADFKPIVAAIVTAASPQSLRSKGSRSERGSKSQKTVKPDSPWTDTLPAGIASFFSDFTNSPALPFFYKDLAQLLDAMLDHTASMNSNSIKQSSERKYPKPHPMLTSNLWALVSRIPPPLPGAETSLLRKHFSTSHLALLRHPLSTDALKTLLTTLHKTLLPHLVEPTRLCDFLTDAYNTGGVVSLLALSGLWSLIRDHGLTYPDFYQRLYDLLTPSVLHTKYKSRFLRLVDLFLSSSHIPSYMVASFVKKLARISLTAPSTSTLPVLTLIQNLLLRHPSITYLIHRDSPSPTTPLPPLNAADPFLMTAPLDANNIADTSLWELSLLGNHYDSAITSSVKTFSASKLTKKTMSSGVVEDLLDLKYAELAASSWARCGLLTPFSVPTKRLRDAVDNNDEELQRKRTRTAVLAYDLEDKKKGAVKVLSSMDSMFLNM